MANTKDNGDSGCFATMLRHLLCRQCVPTHPSDTIGDPDSNLVGPRGRTPKEGSKLVGGRDELGTTLSSGRRAGVVGRLMGLETLPDTKWVPCSKSPDVFSRSRSVNFMDYLLEVDLSSRRAHCHRHRRAKTTVSFREVPVLFPTLLPRPKEKDLLVVILENRDKEEDEREMETRVRPRKCEAHRKKKKKKSDWSSKEKKVLKLRDEPRTRSTAACNHKLGQSNVSARKSKRKDARKQVVAAAADDADGSSPVSMLDKPERHRLQGSYHFITHLNIRTIHFRVRTRVFVFYVGNNLRKSESACPSRKAGSHKSASKRVARILDPVTSPGQKVSAKEEIEFPDSSKHLDDTVWKALLLAEEEVERIRWLLPGSLSREEICLMIEQHALDCLVEELVRISA